MVPLNTQLQNGQTVEVTTVNEGGPSRDWLNADLGYLNSSRGRAKARAWFNAKALNETVARGREAVEKLLQREGGVEQIEMYRTFNCGVGMVIAVDAADAEKTVELLTKLGEKAWNMGHIVDNAESVAGADEKIRVIFA